MSAYKSDLLNSHSLSRLMERLMRTVFNLRSIRRRTCTSPFFLLLISSIVSRKSFTYSLELQLVSGKGYGFSALVVFRMIILRSVYVFPSDLISGICGHKFVLSNRKLPLLGATALHSGLPCFFSVNPRVPRMLSI